MTRTRILGLILLISISPSAVWGHGFKISLVDNKIVGVTEDTLSSFSNMFTEDFTLTDPLNPSSTAFSNHGSVSASAAGSGFTVHSPPQPGDDSLHFDVISPLFYSHGASAAATAAGVDLNVQKSASQSIFVTGAQQSTPGFDLVAVSTHETNKYLNNWAGSGQGAYGFAYQVSGHNAAGQPFVTSDPLVVVFNTPDFSDPALQEGAVNSVFLGVTSIAGAVTVRDGAMVKFPQNGSPGLPPYVGSNMYLKAKSVSVAGSGVLDITNNTLVVDYTGAASPLASIVSLITSGAHVVGGVANWDGPGITSSTAHADFVANPSNALTAVGVLDLGDPSVNPGYDHVDKGVFNAGGPGDMLPASSVLVKYTYLGDTQLAGKVQFSDFLVWKAAFSANLAGGHVGGWAHGQFDYGETQTTFSDFLIWKNSFSKALAGTLPTLHASSVSGAHAVTAVPEPSTLALSLIAAAGAVIGTSRFHRRSRVSRSSCRIK